MVNDNTEASSTRSSVVLTRHVPDMTRLLLCVRAGGRCEFDGHNAYPIAFEPSQLVTGIVVDPLAPDSLVSDVEAVVSRHGYRIPVEKSTLHRVEYLEQMLIRERLNRGL